MKDVERVRDIMSRNVVTIGEGDNLLFIEQGMERFGMRHLPVVNGDRLVGLITHRDVLRVTRRRLKDGDGDKDSNRENQAEVLVSDIMKKYVWTVDPDTPVEEAAKAIVDHHVGCLPVVNGENRLVGIVTEFDLVRLIAKNSES
jgi:CBS domain-containing protein